MGCDYYVGQYLLITKTSGKSYEKTLYEVKKWLLPYYPSKEYDSDDPDPEIEAAADRFFEEQMEKAEKPDKVLCEDGQWVSDFVKEKYGFYCGNDVKNVTKVTRVWPRL